MLVKWFLLFSGACLLTQAAPSNVSSTNFLTNLMGSFRGPNTINITQFLSTFQMPACMKQCLPELDGLLTALSKSNDTRDFAAICSEIQASTHCASSAGCSKVFVEAAASAFQFVCLDNIQAISESMECIKDTALDVQPECEAHCNVQSRIVDDASNNNIEAIFEVPRLCNSTRCLLTCFKNKIDNKCRIGEKNLLDSLLSAVMRGEDHGFDNALDWIMPDTCQRKNSKSSNSTDSPLSVGQVPRGPSKNRNVFSTKSDKINQLQTKTSQEKGKPSTRKSDPMTVRIPPATKTSENIAEPVEAALIIDGEIRTLRYQLLDWQGNPVATPDFESLAKIMTLQLLPFKFPPGRPREVVVLPSAEDEKAAEKRLDERIAKEDNEIEKEKEKKESDADWRTENGPEIVTSDVSNEGVGVAVGMVIFIATVVYWAWEAARDIA